MEPSSLRKVVSAKAMSGFRLRLQFDDGIEGIVDLSYLKGQGVFKLWDDEKFFRKVSVGEHGDVTWGAEVDMCPQALYMKVAKARRESIASPAHA